MPTRSLATVVLFCSATACVLGASSETSMSGVQISSETLSQIEPGDSEDVVLSLLGTPTDRAAKADGSEILKWEYQKETKSGSAILFVLRTKSTKRSSGAVYVRLRDGVVEKVWQDVHADG